MGSKELFFYELEGRGYIFQNKKWDEAKHGFEDDMLNMAWEMWSSAKHSTKAQAVPEGFVVLKTSDVREVLSNASDAMDAESPSSVFTQTGNPSTWYDYHLVAEKNILDAIKAQEPAND